MTKQASEGRALTSIAALSVLGTIVRLASGLVVTKVMALSLGAAGFAQYAQAQNLVSLLASSMATGLGNGVTSTIASERGKSDQIGGRRLLQVVASASSFAIWIAVPLAIALIAAAESVAARIFGDVSMVGMVRSAAAALPFACLAPIPIAALNGQQQYVRCVVAPIITTLLGAIASVTLVSSLGLVGAALSIVTTAALTMVINTALLATQNQKEPLRHWFSPDAKTQRLLVRFAAMAAIGGLASQGSLMFVRTVVADSQGWSTAGQWQAIVKISEVYLSAVTTALSVYYLPRLAAITSRTQFLSLLHGSLLRILPPTIAAAISIYVFREWIFRVALSAEFSQGASLMGIQLVGDVFKVTSFLFAMVMWAKGMLVPYLLLEISASLLYAGLAWWLTDLHGVAGALYAYLGMYVAYLAMCAYVALWVTKWQAPEKGSPA